MQVKPGAYFFSDLGMDSLDAVEMVTAFKDELGETAYNFYYGFHQCIT